MTTINKQSGVDLLAEAARTDHRLGALPATSKPNTVAEALAMQEQLLAAIDKPVAGYKVANSRSGQSMWGAIFAEDVCSSPATIRAAAHTPLGVQGEIAFRLDVDLPQRKDPYSRKEIENAVTFVPVIEVVSSRFESYFDTPVLDRLVDRMSSGPLIVGAPRPDWRETLLSALRVIVGCNGTIVLDRIGGHSRGDPLLPVIDFIHAVQSEKTLEAGQIIAPGTVTGTIFASHDEHYLIEFHGFGRVEATFIGG